MFEKILGLQLRFIHMIIFQLVSVAKMFGNLFQKVRKTIRHLIQIQKFGKCNEDIVLKNLFEIGYGVNIDFSGRLAPTKTQIEAAQNSKLKELKIVALVFN